jgi:hypothetical protein
MGLKARYLINYDLGFLGCDVYSYGNIYEEYAASTISFKRVEGYSTILRNLASR